MKRIVIGLVFLALMSCQSMAQSSVRIQAQAVATCGAQTLTAGTFYPVDQDLTGTLCVSSGGGGGGGLSVTDQATWTNAVSAFTPTGGVFNDSATALTSGHQGTVRLNANREMHVTCDIGNVLCGLINGPTPAGGNIIGKVGIDQTTPGTTNGVAIVGVNGATALAGNGATGTGSPRVTVASDNSPVAGFGVGATAAAPPANSVYIGANASGATGGKLAGMISCDNHVFKHITSATDTLAVQGVASQTIYICAWRARAAGVATWFLENTASANANCSSSNTQITGVATEAANTGEVFAPGFWNGLKNTSGNGLCINSTGTGGVDVDIWYTQF